MRYAPCGSYTALVGMTEGAVAQFGYAKSQAERYDRGGNKKLGGAKRSAEFVFCNIYLL